jgi:nicotinate-nucleotide adenylyltransferase
MVEKIKTGLLFGSFNPIHTGHLVIAQYIWQHTALEEVWFVVSPQNPLKPGQEFLAEKERLELVKLGISGNPAFQASDIEFGMDSPSYTVRTLKKLIETHQERAFFLIIGSDNLEVFDQWKDYKEILEMVGMFVYPRPGHAGKPAVSHTGIVPVQAPLLEISSTRIREMIRAGKDPRYMLPEKVYERIVEKGYYRA